MEQSTPVAIETLPRRLDLQKRGHRGPKSKTGCRQCKTRRIKCSEEKPICQQCSKKKMTCEYALGVGSISSFAAVSALRIQSAPPMSYATPSPVMAFPHSPVAPADEELMLTEVFFATTTHLFSIYTGACNPFMRLRRYLPESRALHLATQAMAAFTISGYQSVDKEKHMNRGLELQRLAYQEITRAMSHPHEAHSDATFAAIIHIGMTEPWHTMRSSESGAMHLRTTKVLICHRAESGAPMPPRFLTNLLIYWDLLVSLHSDTAHEGYSAALLAGPAADEKLIDYIDPTLGLAGDLFPIIIEMETFLRQRRINPPRDPMVIALDLQRRLVAWRPLIDHERLLHCTAVFETASLQDILFTAEAYRKTALLLLYRMLPELLTIPAPDAALRAFASEVVQFLGAIDLNSPVCTTHEWILFVVSPDVTDPVEREFVRDRMAGLLEKIGIEGIRDVMQYIEETWRAIDTRALRSEMWMEEMYRREWYPLLG